ncbi:AAA family ATPase [Janthinobacterium fluminis]|uniref:AAA family ATPase n=1 Tax=Janthinobacterium fluminis TaxID=2987524 RepID=A0ABT5K312_9BURK|nr:AAA family ATPase [Janthinobacterium fluminis]MDC8759254.1 AAA family ATPase [Janthinobacterium fluminis]
MKIVILSKNEKQLIELAGLLRARNPNDDVDIVVGDLDRLAEPAGVDVLLFEQAHIGEDDLEQLGQLGNHHPGLAFVLLCQQHGPEFLLQAMRAGVREVLPSPADAASLYPALRRIEEKRDKHSQASGKVLAFVSCKGGSGATFIAANLAYALAQQENQRVALFDLNLQFGDASLFVSDSKPVATLSNVAQQIHRLDPSFLTSSMVHVTPNFGVLAAPEDPAHANDVKPEHIDQLLKLARRQYDFILLDVGRSLDAVSVRALDQADMIFPILQATLPYIRDGKRLLDVFRSLDYRRDKIHLILNRYSANDEIRQRDLENAYGARIFKSIPNHYEAAAASVNQGVPIIKLARASPISKSLLDFAQSLAGQPEQSNQGWLARVFQRA